MYGVPLSAKQGYGIGAISKDAYHTFINPLIQAVRRSITALLNRSSIMRNYYKKQTFKSADYLNYIRLLECVACDDTSNPVEAHHEGFGVKAYGSKKYIPDSFALPLCCQCHIPKRHQWGYRTFWKEVNLDPKLIVINCLTKYLSAL